MLLTIKCLRTFLLLKLLLWLTIVELATKTVDKVQRDIVVRNKTVKIGDKHGWDTVSEYEGNPLADDSDDERRLLRQAETRAIRKRKATTTKEPPKRMATDKLFRGFSQPPERQNFMSGTLFTPIFYNQKQTYLRRRRKKVSCPRHLLLL